MKIVTIGREFGSGGRELGKRLADDLGFDYYDREIITAISKSQGLNEDYVEKMMDSHAWRTVPVTFRHSFSVSTVMNNPQITLLLEQKKVIEGIAKAGKDCVIVGRNGDVILQDYHPFRIFVCADMEAKVKRCMERAEDGETLSRRQLEQNIRRIDKNRAKTREMIHGSKWGDPVAYDITINTTDWDMKTLASVVADFAMLWFGGKNAHPSTLTGKRPPR